jgi:hypothetical protein
MVEVLKFFLASAQVHEPSGVAPQKVLELRVQIFALGAKRVAARPVITPYPFDTTTDRLSWPRSRVERLN